MKKMFSVLFLLAACSNEAQPAAPVNQSNNRRSNNTQGVSIQTTSSNNGVSTNNGHVSNNQSSSNNSTSQSTMQTTPTIGACVDFSPAIGACDPLCQTGCEMTEHCVTVATDPVESKCETRGVKGQGEACAMNMDCGVGFGCRNFRGDQACRQYCDPSGKKEPQCQVDFACIPTRENRVGICVKVTHNCDILNDSCPAGEECYDFQSGRRCAMAGDKGLGEDCTTSIACVDGLRCVGVGGKAQCRKLCDPNDAGQAGCEGDDTCHTLNAQSGDPIPWGACF